MRQKPISYEVMAELRMMIETLASDAVERALARAGEISFGRIGNAQGDVEVADDKRDAWAHTTDLLTEHKRMPRLYTPAGILFNKPAKDETLHIIAAKDCGGPGAELGIPDGGDGSANHLPEWYDEKAGVSVNGKVAVMESRTDDVEVTAAATKSVTLTAAIVKANGDTYSALKTEDFLTAFATWHTAVSSFINGLVPGTVAPMTPTAAVYGSTKLKHG